MLKKNLFWVFMILWIVFGGWAWQSGNQLVAGGSLLLFVLLFLLGWQVFGFVVLHVPDRGHKVRSGHGKDKPDKD